MRASGSIRDFPDRPRPQTPTLVQFYSEPKPVDPNPDMYRPSFARRTEPVLIAPTELSFGAFRLLPTQFLLLEGDQPVSLGSRALEILIVLLERPGELVSKQELMDRVWPNVFVAPANLTVHISILRRTLRDGQDGNRFIINIPGRGYKFVASVAAVHHEQAPHANVSPRVSEIRRYYQANLHDRLSRVLISTDAGALASPRASRA
jgi:DNA-binding winged helix-turn-helix (wHTH) protein